MPKKSQRKSDKALIAQVKNNVNRPVLTKSVRRALGKQKEDMNHVAFRIVQEATPNK
jgi:hypothetical protein